MVELDSAPIKDAGRKAGGLAGLVSAGVITALIQLGTFLFIDKPKARQSREMELDKSAVESLERALAVESDHGRRMSIRLMLATGALDPEDSEQINALLAGKDTFPRWVRASDARRPTGQEANVAQQGTGASTAEPARR